MLHTIKVNDIVNHIVFLVVGCSFFIFLNISTRFRQKIIAKIGVKKEPVYSSIVCISVAIINKNILFEN